MTDLSLSENGRVIVTGKIGFKNARNIYQEGLAFIAKQNDLIFDLGDLQAEDSSILALLTAWYRYANNNQKTLRYENLPKRLAEIARLCNLDKVLPF